MAKYLLNIFLIVGIIAIMSIALSTQSKILPCTDDHDCTPALCKQSYGKWYKETHTPKCLYGQWGLYCDCGTDLPEGIQ